MFIAIVNTRSGLDVGALLDQALRACGMTHKEAWLICGFTNAAEWSRAIEGVRKLDLHALACLPIGVQEKFFELYMAAQANRHVRALVADRLRMAKATIPDFARCAEEIA